MADVMVFDRSPGAAAGADIGRTGGLSSLTYSQCGAYSEENLEDMSSSDSDTDLDSSDKGYIDVLYGEVDYGSPIGSSVTRQGTSLRALTAAVTEMVCGDSGTASDISNIGSHAGSEVSGNIASLSSTVRGAIGGNVPKKRRLDDDMTEPQCKKLRVCAHRDTWKDAESHFAADGDRSGQSSNDTISTRKSSRDNNMGRSLRSSKTIESERQVSCLQERIECPFKALLGVVCDWVGSQSCLVDHSKTHGAEVQEKLGPFVVKLQKVSKSKSFHKAIAMWGNLFYMLWVKKEDTMRFIVYVIPKQTSEEYTYDIKLRKGQEEISVTGGKCSSFLQPQCEGIEKGDIFTIHCHKVRKFLDTNDNLSCIIEIRREYGTPSSGEADKT